MPAGASEDFLFCAVEIDSLLLLLLIHCSGWRRDFVAKQMWYLYYI